MRISDIRVLQIPGDNPLIEVETDGRIVGIGFTQSPSHIIAAIIEEGPLSLKRLLIGEDPRETGRLWRKMFTEWPAQRGRGDEGGVAVNAMAAIDLALWDITGKAHGLPIYQLLGGAVQTRIMAYASATAVDPELSPPDGAWIYKTAEQMAAEAERYVAQGFKAIKFGWGNYFGVAGEAALAAIRGAIGPEIRLMLDFGCPEYWTPNWDVKDAIRVARMAERFDCYFLEEAFHPRAVASFAALTNAVSIKIATGESLTTSYDFQPLIDGRAVDIIQPDAAQIGITQFLRVARRAEEAGVLCIPHSPWSALVVAAHLNLLATLSNGAMIEWPADYGSKQNAVTGLYHRGIVEHPLVLQDGYVSLPQYPGLGLGQFVPAGIEELRGLVTKRMG